MTQPYPLGETESQQVSPGARAALHLPHPPEPEPTADEVAWAVLTLVRALVAPPTPIVEHDGRDAEARALLADFYTETWAMARAQDTTKAET